MVGAITALAVGTWGAGARAADVAPPPPSWAAGRPQVPDLPSKTEGGFFDAVPEGAYDPNTGFGLGVGGHYTFDGSRSDSLFAYTPYRHRIFAQVYATTGGYQQHFLSYEGIYVGDSPYRLRAAAIYERNTSANYFGNGTSTLAELNYLGTRYPTYSAAASAAPPNYYHYQYEKPQGEVLLERAFLGGRVRALYIRLGCFALIWKFPDASAGLRRSTGNSRLSIS